MIKHGLPPYLECSSAGDRRFSAFYAIVDGDSIENIYQASKVFEDGSTGLHWRQAKGKKAINQDYCNQLYSRLWDQYIDEHPELLSILKMATGVTDKYGQEGHCCQATELWRIRNK